MDALKAVLDTDLKLDEGSQKEVSRPTARLYESAKKVFKLIKYCLEQEIIDERLLSVKGCYWSSDNKQWKPLPEVWVGALTPIHRLQLNKETEVLVQNYIDTDFQPLLALRHLHRAKNERNPRYKWIDATIAAELAIKQFLVQKDDTIKTLLLELPSPPLEKLYGIVLESLIGKESPKRKELKKGSETRNKLMHRPEEVAITPNEASHYIHDVEIAIYHLLTLLNPQDTNVQRLYADMIKRDNREDWSSKVHSSDYLSY